MLTGNPAGALAFMDGMAAWIELEAQGLGGDNLANRADEMPVWRELATGIGGLKLGDSPIDRGDRGGQLETSRQ